MTVVAVGALGGSGTRVVAQVLKEGSAYIGGNFNKYNGNLIFTRRFVDPEWYKTSDKEQLLARLDVFREYMEHRWLSYNSLRKLISTSRTNNLFRDSENFKRSERLFWVVVRNIFRRPGMHHIWGWKEPNTHIYLNELADYFSDLRYVHVVRHGLVMAFSDNKRQLCNWGYIFDISVSGRETPEELAYKQLSYWVKSTQAVMENSCAKEGRFFLLNHTEFCTDPRFQACGGPRLNGFRS